VSDGEHESAPRYLRFVWDEQKNRANIQKHGLDFNDVALVFRRRTLVRYDDRDEYGEDRWIGAGWLIDIIVVIVFTEPDPQTIRVISMRKASRHEREWFYREITH
jgi:uncharacterized protein